MRRAGGGDSGGDLVVLVVWARALQRLRRVRHRHLRREVEDVRPEPATHVAVRLALPRPTTTRNSRGGPSITARGETAGVVTGPSTATHSRKR